MNLNLNSNPEAALARKKLISRIVNVAVYGSATWVAVALVGYGMAVDQHDGQARDLTGRVFHDLVVERSGLGRGYFGDVCFVIRKGPRFCIKQSYWDHSSEGPGNVYQHLAPGTDVFIKSIGEHPAELIANPDDPERKKTLLVYNTVYSQILKDSKSVNVGPWYSVFGFLLVPAVWLLRRFLFPKFRRKWRERRERPSLI